MSHAEYRNTSSWQDSLALGPLLVSLTEDLPAHEQIGLVMQIQQLMVELPAMVAADLADGTSLRFAPLYRLIASLELIERVYPALDAGTAKQAVEALETRLAGDDFAAAVPAPVPAPIDDESDDTDTAPEPAAVPVLPAAEPVPVSAAFQPTEVNSVHVQPDSL